MAVVVLDQPAEHVRIEEILKQIDVKGPDDKEAKAIAYKLDGANATQSYYILLFLTQSVPTARFTMGVSPDQIIAWAQPKVHEDIAELIEQIQGGADNAPKPIVYQLKNVTASSVLSMPTAPASLLWFDAVLQRSNPVAAIPAASS